MKSNEWMKRYVEVVLEHEGGCFSSLEVLENKAYGIKRRIVSFKGVDQEGYYHLLVVWCGSTRFLLKDMKWLEKTHYDIEAQCGHAIKKMSVWLPYAPICSKAQKELSHSWRIYHDLV